MAQLIQQRDIKAHKAIIPSGMGDQAHRPTPVSSIDNSGDIIGGKGASSTEDNLLRLGCASVSAIVLHKSDQSMGLLRAWGV
jgi:hypothetical protein